MPDPGLTLSPNSPLNGFHEDFGAVKLSEISGRSLVSVAVPAGGEREISEKIGASFETTIPPVGASRWAGDGQAQLLGMQRDQFFILFASDEKNPLGALRASLADTGYYTDQSDSWAMLSIEGEMSRDCLARICPLDLHCETFLEGQVARTVMEHLAVIILRTGRDDFLLLSPRSSAGSFLHAVLTSVKNVIGHRPPEPHLS